MTTEIGTEHEAIAEELTQFWQSLNHRGAIIQVLHSAQASKLQQIESRLKRLSDRQRTVLHLATGPLHWTQLDDIFGRLGGVALGTDAMLKEYPRRSGTQKQFGHIDWLVSMFKAKDESDISAQILADIGRDAINEFGQAIHAYSRTRLLIVGRMSQ